MKNETKNINYSSYLDSLEQLGYSDPDLIDKIKNIPNDSIKNELFFKYSYHYYLEGDSTRFFQFNNLSRQISKNLKDTSKLAESYWDLANFYFKNNKTDSSYFYYNTAYKLYNITGEDFYSGRMLLNMAIIEKNIKDYTGSEVTTFQAIKKLGNNQHPYQLYIAYNNLGIIFNALREYDESLHYHNLALNFQESIRNDLFKAMTFNNIGVVHKDKRDYLLAIESYKKALEVDSIFEKRPQLYAMLIDNIAFAKLKMGLRDGVEEKMQRALDIRDSINHFGGIVVNKLHLAELSLVENDTLKAIKLAKDAKKISEKINANQNLLETLLFLSKVERSSTPNYLNEYIALSDSLQREERVTRNKFARIRFETDQFISENQQLNEERKWVFGISTIVILFLVLLYIIRTQRINNKRLILERQQQEANEEIYHLMIASQEKMEEGKNKAKKRISEELHDGILSKFFGVRLNLEILSDRTDDKSCGKRKEYLNELKQIESEIRNVSHELNSDLFSANISFIRIIEELIEEHKAIGQYKCTLKIDENINWEKVNSKLKVHLYRILQESFHNINKHAKANEVKVEFYIANKFLILRIIDDGQGFDLEMEKEGIGLKNLKSRVRELNGDFTIKSDSNGTVINISFPFFKMPQNEKKYKDFDDR